MLMAGHSSVAWRNDSRRLLGRVPVLRHCVSTNRVEARELDVFGNFSLPSFSVESVVLSGKLTTFTPQAETDVYFAALKNSWA